MKKVLILSLLSISTLAVAQVKKTTTPAGRSALTVGRPTTKPAPKASLQATAPVAQPAPVAQTAPAPAPAPVAVPVQARSDTRQNSRTTVVQSERTYDYGSVVKLNFMGLIVGGVNLDFEKRVAPRTAVVLTGGIYPYGLLKGSYRLGADLRQYLGESYVPKGLFVSAGGVYHFIPYDNTSAGLLNLRGFVGYQFVTGHVTFEVAGGLAYGIIITDSKNLSNDQSRLTLGLLPAFKASIGYAF